MIDPLSRLRRRLPIIGLVVVSLVGSAAGCSPDEEEAGDGDVSGRMDTEVAVDVGETGVDTRGDTGRDTRVDGDVDGGTLDSADDGDMAADTGGWDPTLEELGDIPSECPTRVVEAGEGTPGARVFTVAHRMDEADLRSHRAFRESIHRTVFEQVLPCRVDGAPDVVLYPESMSLPMLLIGPKAEPARAVPSASRALITMLGQVNDAYRFYDEQFEGPGQANTLLLAMTDPVVRATYDTFGRIAERYGLYVSVTVDLPDFEETTDPAIVDQVGDPDLGGLESAYVATGPEVYNQQILFGPDGQVVDRTTKTYVTQMEIETLEIAPGRFRDIRPMETSWGRTGVVISKPAWMPDVQARLDDLGADLTFQPEAFAGGWIFPPDRAEPGRWNPDVFSLGGWNLVQRAPRIRRNLVPQLTGNYFDIVFDGQVQYAADIARTDASAAFVGQRAPLPGNPFVGPWVVEDPGDSDPTLSLEERRQQLREVAGRLAPGSGDGMEGAYVEGIWAFDLPADLAEEDGPEVRTHPDAAVGGGRRYVVSSVGSVGERGLRVEVTADDGSDPNPATVAVDDFDLIRPRIAADGSTLHIVAEAVAPDANRLLYARVDGTGGRVEEQRLLAGESFGDWCYHPDVSLADGTLQVTWVREVEGANRIFHTSTPATDPFASSPTVTPVEPRPEDRPPLRANQWDGRVAATADRQVVTWIDFKHWRWEVLASYRTAGGSWSDPVKVDAVPTAVEAINSTPDVAAVGPDRFLVTWTGARATRLTTRARGRFVTFDASGAPTWSDVFALEPGADQGAWQWRPRPTSSEGEALVAWESMNDGKWSIRMRRVTDASTLGSVGEVGPSLAGKHFPVAVPDGSGMAVAFEETPAADSELESALRVESP